MILLFKQQSVTSFQSQTPMSLSDQKMNDLRQEKMHAAAFAHNTRSGIFNSPMDQWLRMPPSPESKLSSGEQAVFLNLGGRRTGKKETTGKDSQ